MFDFYNTGEFRASGGATFGSNITVSWGGRTATFHEKGDVTGPVWGGTLYSWIEKKVNRARKRTREVVIWSGSAWQGMKVTTNEDILGALIYLRYAEWSQRGTYVPFMVPVNIGSAATVAMPGNNWLTIKPTSTREFEILNTPVAFDEILLSE